MKLTWEGKPIAQWQKQWQIPLLEVHESLTSTNSRARELIKKGGLSFTTVVAETQTEGRCRDGSRWHSPKGKGLWMSFLLQNPSTQPATIVPALTGLALLEAMESVCDSVDLGIKWPNDLVINGKKVGGILCEAFGKESLVVGIGVNLSQKPDDFPEFLLGRAISIEMSSGQVVEPSSLVGPILSSCKSSLDPLPAALSPKLIERLGAKSTVIGTGVSLSNGSEGVVTGFSPLGAMLVLTKNNLHHINSTAGIRFHIDGSKR